MAFAIVYLHALDTEALSGYLFDIAYGSETFLFISQMISGNGYFFQFIDRISKERTLFEKIAEQFKQTQEENAPLLERQLNSSLRRKRATKKAKTSFIGLSIGLLGAVALSVADILLNVSLPFTGLGAAFSIMIMFIGNLSLCGGLGNRTGHTVGFFQDPDPFHAKEFYYTCGVLTGLFLGFALTVAAVAYFGLGLITGGALPAITFVVTMFGGSASASGYVGRIFDAIRKKSFNKEQTFNTVGVILGLATFAVLFTLGLATLPLFGAGLPKLILSYMLLVTCISCGGGLGRIGYAFDRNWKFSQAPKKAMEEKPPSLNIQEATAGLAYKQISTAGVGYKQVLRLTRSRSMNDINVSKTPIPATKNVSNNNEKSGSQKKLLALSTEDATIFGHGSHFKNSRKLQPEHNNNSLAVTQRLHREVSLTNNNASENTVLSTSLG